MRKGSEEDVYKRREMVNNEKTAINEGEKSGDDDEGNGSGVRGRGRCTSCIVST
jgi:hypothetical protein